MIAEKWDPVQERQVNEFLNDGEGSSKVMAMHEA